MKFKPILFYLIFVNVTLFLMMEIDKWKAVHHKWRIPEKILLSLGLFSGGIGGWMGLLVFNHKKSKWYFKLVYFIGMLISLILIYYNDKLNWFF